MSMSKSYGNIGGISVCKDCGDRRIGCHGVCKDYCEEVSKASKVKEAKRKEADLRNAFADVRQSRLKTYHRSNNVPQRNHMK